MLTDHQTWRSKKCTAGHEDYKNHLQMQKKEKEERVWCIAKRKEKMDEMQSSSIAQKNTVAQSSVEGAYSGFGGEGEI
eukprot:14571477-Ditylum_brightwellii.AAC.2